MEKLHIQSTDNEPEILLDPENNIFEISGNSLPENVNKTYIPVLNWLDTNLPKATGAIKFDFKIDYLNSSSGKFFYDIIKKLNHYHQNESITLQVNWFYHFEDDDMEAEGLDYKKIAVFPFKMIAVDDDDNII